MRRFFDTNVLVYAQDPSAASKRVLAQSLVSEAMDDKKFVISTQVLVEFYATVLRRRLLAPGPALALVKLWSEHDVVPNTPELVLHGLELHQAHSVSVWDAMVMQAAIEARCDILFSEDFQHGRRFGDLEVVNPFLAPTGAHEPRAAYAEAKHARRPPSVRTRHKRPAA